MSTRTKQKKEKSLAIKPLSDRVVIKPDSSETKTAGGIIIPDTSKEKPTQGTVMAVGVGRGEDKLVVKVGDKVLYSKYSGTLIEHENEEYLIMRESDLLCIVHE